MAALLARGFAVEARAPLMVLDALRSIPVPEGAELIEAEDETAVRALVAVPDEAYGGEPPTDEEVRRQWRRVQDGTIALLARVGGEPAGGGLVLPPDDGLTEVTSIGVRAPFRRRGLAAALVARLTELARAGGAELPFLMAAAEAEAGSTRASATGRSARCSSSPRSMASRKGSTALRIDPEPDDRCG